MLNKETIKWHKNHLREMNLQVIRTSYSEHADKLFVIRGKREDLIKFLEDHYGEDESFLELVKI